VPNGNNQSQQLLFDDPALMDFTGGTHTYPSGYSEPFNMRTGEGALKYAQNQARQSLGAKVKTTGQQSAEDIDAAAKETYGPLYSPIYGAGGQVNPNALTETLHRNASINTLPEQAAGFAGMPLKQAARAAAGGFAGGVAGAYGGGHAGHYLGGIPGRLMRNPKLEAQGAGVGETLGAIGGGMIGGYGGGAAAMSGAGIPLRLRLGGASVEGEMPMGGVGRAGSAGDLASWGEQDLWSGYMKNRGTPQGEAIAKEIQRRGLAQSPAGTYRPPVPMASSQPLKARVAAGTNPKLSAQENSALRNFLAEHPERVAALQKQAEAGDTGAQQQLRELLQGRRRTNVGPPVGTPERRGQQ
jgi:hypothetical protein